MHYVTQEQIEKAKQMDIVTYLEQCEPGELVRVNKRVYTTRSHDSLKISNGMWCWWSRGIGGKTALDFLIKVRGLPFTDAVEYLSGCPDYHIISPTVQAADEVQTPFVLPLPYRNNDRVVEYLCGRGIDRQILDVLIREGRIYEDNRHNCVFVGFDGDTAKYAMIRSTAPDSKFMIDVEGSDKRHSFSVFQGGDAGEKTLFVFESAIDLLSKLSLDKLYNLHIPAHYLSMAGVSRYTKLPIALASYLERNPKIENIYLHLDNDRAGRQAAKTIKELLPERYKVKIFMPPKSKDMNDYLIMVKNLAKQGRSYDKDRS